MATEVFNRYEHKYILTENVYQKVIDVVGKRMEPDAYNAGLKPYTIANIYYDTRDDYLIRQSLSKPIYKEKLRLRSYGTATADDMVYLEIKKKFNGIVNKRRTGLKLSEAYEFVKNGKISTAGEYMNKQVVNEISYFLSVYKPVPKVYIAYDRIAYYEKGNPDLRISFDCNIRSRRTALVHEDGTYGQRLLDDGLYLMEIKTSLAKPLWLTHMLAKYDIRRCSFSKYGTEFKKIQANTLPEFNDFAENAKILKQA